MFGNGSDFSSALYYPRISMQDPSFFKTLSLLYDRVYRIVPDGIIPDDNEELQPLIEAGIVGKAINPIPYSKRTAVEFLKKAENWNAAALDSFDDDIDISRIHREKTDRSVRRLFEELGYAVDDDWYSIPTELASNYMLYLSKEIAGKNQLDLMTDEIGPWTATSYFNVDGEVDDLACCDVELLSPDNPFMLYSFILEQLFPVNIAEIPAHSLVKFKEKRHDEIRNLRETVFSLYAELSKVTEHDIRVDVIEQRVKELQIAQSDYQKSADIMNAQGWFGVSMFSFPGVGVLGTMLGLEPLASTILAGACALVGTIVNMSSTKESIKQMKKASPASGYMALSQDFRQFKDHRGGRDISHYAWNSMEEYVND